MRTRRFAVAAALAVAAGLTASISAGATGRTADPGAAAPGAGAPGAAAPGAQAPGRDPLDPAAWPLPVSDAPCPDGPTATVALLDLVHVGGRQYGGVGLAPPSLQLGRTLLTTRCRWADGAPDDGYRPRDGDASFLPRGTAVREVVGHDPAFRVAALGERGVQLFEAPPPERDGTGADVLPRVGPHVRAVHLLSRRDDRVVARIADPARVARLVRELLAAPYRTVARGGSDAVLVLRLDDGTTVRRSYDSVGGGVLPGLRLPPRARDELAEALATGEGQPAPRCVAVPGDVSGLGIDPEAEELVGLTEAQAAGRARAAGETLRVVGRDGRCGATGPRLQRGRVDVDVRDGVVRDAARY